MRSRLVLVFAVVALVAGACAEDGPEEATETPDTQEPVEEAPADGTVTVADSDYGEILVDDEGFTLYAFMPDEGGEPTCTDDCLDNWPLLEGPADAGEGADASLLGTAEHPSGDTQATYNDWPLYYFTPDEAPGDTNGQGVADNWYVVSPAGELITG